MGAHALPVVGCQHATGQNALRRASNSHATSAEAGPKLRTLRAHAQTARPFGSVSRSSMVRSQRNRTMPTMVFGWFKGSEGPSSSADSSEGQETLDEAGPLSAASSIAGTNTLECERSGPLLPQSRQGAALAACLRATPELFEEAVDYQLEVLITERELDRATLVSVQGPGAGSGSAQTWAKQEAELRRRIKQVKASERTCALEDVLYTSILAKHLDFHVQPTTGSTPEDVAWLHSPASKLQLQALLDMQPSQAIQLIAEHVRAATTGLPEFHQTEPTLLPKLGIAQVYRRGILFGYTLEQVIERHELEQSVTHFDDNIERKLTTLTEYAQQVLNRRKVQDMTTQTLENSPQSEQEESETDTVAQHPPSLEDGACFQTEEAMRVAERHATAVFGSILDMANGLRDVIAGAPTIDEAQTRMEFAMEDGQLETVSLTLAAVCHLVMEGVAIGRHLRQAERNVDMRYGLEPLVL